MTMSVSTGYHVAEVDLCSKYLFAEILSDATTLSCLHFGAIHFVSSVVISKFKVQTTATQHTELRA